MDESYEQALQLRALAMRLAALEENVAFLEEWCEEQQDTLDRGVGPAARDLGEEAETAPHPRPSLRIVDVSDSVSAAQEYRHRLTRLRGEAESLTDPDDELPDFGLERSRDQRYRTGPDVSAKQAGRTAP